MTYPKYLILPEPEDFVHGDWATGDVAWDYQCGEATPQAALEDCGSRFCLVGMAAAAFGENIPEPEYIDNLETAEFLRCICNHLKRPVRKRPVRSRDEIRWVCEEASNAFEGTGPDYGNLSPVTPEEAAKAWRAAAEELGYDVKGAKYRD